MNDQDFLSLRDFAKLTGIEQSKLRYYDEVGLFKPIKRGANNYRYYSAPQAVAVNYINAMRSLNFPIKKIKEMKKKRDPKLVSELLQKYELELNQELFRLQQTYAIIHIYSRLIQEGLLADEQIISNRWMDVLPIQLGEVNDFSSGYIYDSFFSFIRQMADHKISPAYPAGGFYDDMDTFINVPGQPPRFFSCAPAGQHTKEAGEYVVGYTRGYYGNLGDLPQRMQAYAKEHGFTFTGPVYEIYLHDEIAIEDPDQYLIQVSVPVKMNKRKT